MWFFVRRLGELIVALLVASVVIFVLLRLLPGDLAVVIGGVEATPERLAAIREDLGLDRPLLTQYFDWMGGVLTGDFGESALTQSTVTSQLGEKLTITAPLIISSSIVAMAGAVPLGVYAAVRRRQADGVGLSAVGQLGIAIPQFLVGIILIALFAGVWGLPSQGFPRNGWDGPGQATQVAGPPDAHAGRGAGGDPAALRARRRRSTCSTRTTSAPPGPRVYGRTEALMVHGLRNAAIPVISVIGVQIASLIAGVVVIEEVFNLPGVGQMLVRDIGNRDFDKVQGTILLIAAIVLVIGFLVDLAHYLIDPRLRTVPDDVGSRGNRESWSGRIGLALVALLVVSVIVSFVWVPHDPLRVVPSDAGWGSPVDHWFGTDGAGKDLFSQVLVGARVACSSPSPRR